MLTSISSREGSIATGQRLRALVVDDDAAVCGFVSDALNSFGYDAEGAPDGARAVGLLDRQSYDVLVIDLRMPQMSGWEVVEVVSRRRSIPTVIMSGFITPADEERARAAGIAVLHKPFGVETLKRAIRDVMPIQPHVRTGPAETDAPEGGRSAS